MEWVETTGRTVQDALEAALDQLGVDEHDAEIEVVSEPKLGLFGRLKSEARIRVRVRPTAPRPKEGGHRKRRRDKGEKGEKAGSGGAIQRGDRARHSETAGRDETDAKAEAAPRPSKARQSDRGRKGARANEGGTEVDHDVALEQQGEVAREFLQGLLVESGATATIDIAVDEAGEVVNVGLSGSDLSHFIGPRGAALNALQDVTRTVVQRKTGARNGRIMLDVASYREKRREALERFSRKVAAEVIEGGVLRILEPMSSADRKVVHDVVNEIDGVTTSSEGEEPRRRVVIRPSDD